MSLLALRAILNQQAQGWSPLDLPSLSGWWDASDAGSFTFSSGTSVSQWNDLSGNGRHVTQSTGADQPSRNATMNGLDVVNFAGSGDRLARTNCPLNNASDGTFTAFVVCKPSGFIAGQTMCAIGQDAGAARIAQTLYFSGSGGTIGSLVFGNPFSVYSDSNGSGSTGTAYLLGVVRATGTVDVRVNGASNGSAATANPNAYSASATWWIGYLGDVTSTANSFQGDIAEVIYCADDLGASDIDAVETYLADKWGITI